MARLTQQEKDWILTRALRDTFQKREGKLQIEWYYLSSKVFREMYTAEERALMKTIPAGWLDTVTDVYFSHPAANKSFMRLSFNPAIQAPHQFNINTVYSTTMLSTELHDAFTKYFLKEKQLAEQQETLKSKLKLLLKTITTDKKLSEVWPEGTKYLTVCDTTENLPMVTSSEIVTMMTEFKEN